jgi:4-hydroxy-L-threonine phosphate dehydrogenase PdxA
VKIAIATGDPAGIGPEISLKAARDPRVLAMCEPVLIGERPALEAAEVAIRGALEGKYDAVVAAPHIEANIRATGAEFDGYPSFVARLCGLPPEAGVLMLCFEHRRREIRISHVTLHSPVEKALRLITAESVLRTIRATEAALKRMGIEKPRLAVSGVNPHAAGEAEERIIRPAIAGVADGPFGADTLIQREGYDAYVVMLHDQGHIPAKVLAPNAGAALTIGTPVRFSSVAHGAALDIAGRGQASHEAMVEAIARLVSPKRDRK